MSDTKPNPDFADPACITIMRIPKADRAKLRAGKVFLGDAAKPSEPPTKVEYSSGRIFEVSRYAPSDLAEFGNFVQQTLQPVQHAFLMRSAPIVGINLAGTPRNKLSFVDVPRHWHMVDFDHMPGLPRGTEGALAARDKLPPEMRAASAWFQRTGSYGVAYKDRPKTDDPWAGRLRLGFWLDKPLYAYQVKAWMARYPTGADLSFYDIVRPLYTAAPLFSGCADPLLDANEPRFGWLCADNGAGNEPVVVPPEIAALEKSIPDQRKIRERMANIDAPTEAALLRELDAIENIESKRHADVRFWVCNAYGLGMDPEKIASLAAKALADLRRGADIPNKEERGEAQRLVEFATNNEANGQLWVSSNLCPQKDFESALDEGGPTLPPEKAKAQAEELAPWWTQLDLNEDGGFRPTEHNGCVIFEHHSYMNRSGHNCLAFDMFSERAKLRAAPPWWDTRHKSMLKAEFSKFGYVLRDADYEDALIWMQSLDAKKMGDEGTSIRLAKTSIPQCLHHVARVHAWNPVTDWLDACADNWDKIDRLADVPERILMVRDMPKRLMKTYFKKWMVQAVRRCYEPGAKADSVLVLQGGEGAKKSTFLQGLLPSTTYFKEGLSDIGHKDALVELRGTMIVEFAEGFALKKADSDALKAFITKTHDIYRDPYGISTDEHPRTCVFASCVNDAEFLPQAGGRRWWVLPVPTEEELLRGKRIDLVTAKRERDLWWGEAVHLYRNGYECWLDDDTDTESRKHNVGFSSEADSVADVQRWLDTPASEGGPAHPDWVRPKEVWDRALKLQPSNSNKIVGGKVADCMKAIGGWNKTQFGTIRGFVRIGSRMEKDVKYRDAVFATLYDGAQEVALDFVASPTH